MEPGLELHQARDERCLWTDHDQVRPSLPAEGKNTFDILRLDGQAVRNLRDAGVSRRAPQGFALCRGGKPPAEGVFATAAADHKNLHRSTFPFPSLL